MAKPIQSRTIILAFDGTTNELDDTNTNVVNLCALLRTDCPLEQIVYYQPGIGTYTEPGITSTIRKQCAKLMDVGIAWYLSNHICDGYRYLMNNYVPGDRILIFGFSRGAYTGRALAGMLHKVGLLSKGNEEQIPFAYKIYQNQLNDHLANKFKRIFCKQVHIDFLGVWDTVASVGTIVPKKLPFTSCSTIKIFRHAVSLDERRTRFDVTLWKEDKEAVETNDNNFASRGVQQIKECWFAGNHSDVGGGNMKDGQSPCLANISFRWMLRELVEAKVGILFDPRALNQFGIPRDVVPRPTLRKDTPLYWAMETGNHTLRHGYGAGDNGRDDGDPDFDGLSELSSITGKQADEVDALGPMHDQLKDNPGWWLLQFPFCQKWFSKKPGQRIFPGTDGSPSSQKAISTRYIHRSVKHRIDAGGYSPNGCLPDDWEEYLTD